jgi:hypothetical protein
MILFSVVTVNTTSDYNSISRSITSSIQPNEISNNIENILYGGLLDYIETGDFPRDGYKNRVIVISSTNDMLDDNIYPKVKVGNNYLHFLPSQTPNDVRSLALNPDVNYVMPDYIVNQTESTELFGLDDNSIETDSYIASDILGVADVWKDYNITGTNITIGIVDTGVDFGVSDLQDSAVILSDGYTANFDPTGMGIVLTSLSMAPVTLAGGTFLLLEDREVTVRIAEQDQFVSNLDLGIQLKDLEITGLSKPSQSSSYKVGMMFQPGLQQGLPSQVIIFILSDSVTEGVYDTLYVDMDTSLGLTLAYNGLIFESGSAYLSLVDWSLTNEVPYNANNPIVAKDLTGDGINDFSAGSLSTSIIRDPDTLDVFMIEGIHESGAAIVMMYDPVGHGTLSAASAVARGNTPISLFDDKATEEVENNTVVFLPGSAPGAKIIATRGFTLSDFVIGWFWVAGLEPDSTGEFAVINKEHLVDITSNSWGSAAIAEDGTIKGMDFNSLLLDMLSTPEELYSGYPGMIAVVSSGNGGPGDGTIAAPGTASTSITVGASNSFQFLNHTGRDDVAWFSGRGPTPYGLIKPDVVAPGNTGYTLHNLITGYGNGTYAAGTFGGTSESAPRAAGSIALLMQALKQNELPTDLGTVRTILKSTAKDLGFSPTAQGAGLIDAYKAVTSIFGGDQLILSSNYSAELAGDRLQEAYQFYFDTDHPLFGNPVKDTLLSIDETMLSDGLSISVNYANGTEIKSDQFNSDVERLLRTDMTEFNFSSLSAEQTIVQFDQLPANWEESDLLWISLSLDEISWNGLRSAGFETPDLILYDSVSQRYVYDIVSFRTWTQQVYSGNPGEDFISTPSIKFTDPGYINNVPNWQGLNYQVYAQIFNYQSWNGITEGKSNGEITIQGNKDEYQFASLKISTSTSDIRIPMLLAMETEAGYADNKSLIQPDGDFVYDLAQSYGSFDWGYRPESGDFNFYRISVPNNASYLAIQISWVDFEFYPDLYLFNQTGHLMKTSDVTYLGGGIYDSGTSDMGSQNMIIETNDEIYTLLMHIAQFPFVAGPIDFNVTIRYLTLDEINGPGITFSQNINSTIGNILSISALPFDIDEFPELDISGIGVEVAQGSNGTHSDVIANQDLIVGIPSSISMIEDEILLEFDQGEVVYLELSWEGILDADIYVISPLDSNSLDNDLLAGQGARPGGRSEQGSFGATTQGIYTILIDFVLAGQAGIDFEYTLSWESRQGPNLMANGNTVGIDTALFANGEYELFVTIDTNFGLKFNDYAMVEFFNHNDFTIELISPTDGESLSGDVDIAWSASTPVEADIYLDYGETEYLIANSIEASTYSFDSKIYPNGDLVIRVSLTNGIYVHELTVSVSIENGLPSTLAPITTENTNLFFNFGFVLIGFTGLIVIKRRFNLQS